MEAPKPINLRSDFSDLSKDGQTRAERWFAYRLADSFYVDKMQWNVCIKYLTLIGAGWEPCQILCAHRSLTRGVGRFRELLRAVETRTTQNLRMVSVTADLVEARRRCGRLLSLSYINYI